IKTFRKMSLTPPKPPQISICTITLNNRNGLVETGRSIAAQKYQDFEWLVQDGGSADGSLEYLKTTKAVTQSKTDKGIYDAMNRLIDRAAGAYLIFLNAGDRFAAPDTLEIIAETINRDKPDFIYGDAYEGIGATHSHKKARPHTAIKRGMITHHQAMIYARSIIGDTHYDLQYKIAADYDFTAKILQKAQHVQHIQNPLCVFESGGISQQNAALGRHEQYQIRKTLNLCPPLENTMITTLQALNWQLRRFAPPLYWLSKRL
ncbi:MAG: glycosyltransferase family 2 protein, partial [Bdellovibrionales bacterium]